MSSSSSLAGRVANKAGPVLSHKRAAVAATFRFSGSLTTASHLTLALACLLHCKRRVLTAQSVPEHVIELGRLPLSSLLQQPAKKRKTGASSCHHYSHVLRASAAVHKSCLFTRFFGQLARPAFLTAVLVEFFAVSRCGRRCPV